MVARNFVSLLIVLLRKGSTLWLIIKYHHKLISLFLYCDYHVYFVFILLREGIMKMFLEALLCLWFRRSIMDNCRHVAALTVAANSSVLNPQKWSCQICGTTESVWVSITLTVLFRDSFKLFLLSAIENVMHSCFFIHLYTQQLEQETQLSLTNRAIH